MEHNSSETGRDIAEQVAFLRLKGYAPSAIRHLTGLSAEELKEIRKQIRRTIRGRLLRDAQDILQLHANRRVEYATVARGGEVVEDEVFGCGPLPRSSSPALDEDGDVAMPSARIVDAEELCAPVLRELGWVI